MKHGVHPGSLQDKEHATGPARQVSGSQGDSRPNKQDGHMNDLEKTSSKAGALQVKGGARLMPNPTAGGHKPQKSGSCGG